jgi:hypothetical protein
MGRQVVDKKRVNIFCKYLKQTREKHRSITLSKRMLCMDGGVEIVEDSKKIISI